MGEFFRGLRFGVLLQLSVGPVCLFVFQTGAAQGWGSAWAAVAAVTLVDAAFIGLALVTKAAFLSKPGVGGVVKALGSAVLLVFGVDLVLGAWGAGFLPRVAAGAGWGGPFVGALVLTASNPLTILFWTGVFASRVGNGNPLAYGLGALVPTPVFLGAVGGAGTVAAAFVPAAVVTALNVGVGVVFVGYALAPVARRLMRRIVRRPSSPG